MISCEIRGRTFIRSLLDTGARVNILPKKVYDICPRVAAIIYRAELSGWIREMTSRCGGGCDS